jgi:poly-gamma-glutamate synthesis protein (capsule biosynthesis protein)
VNRKIAVLFLTLMMLLTACVKPYEPTAGSENTLGTATDPDATLQTSMQTEPQPTAPSQPDATIPEPSIPEPTVPDDDGVKKITLSFVGDCTLGGNQKHSYTYSFAEKYDQNGPEYFLERVRDIFENDDITVINLEGSLTTSTDIQDKLYNHKGDPEYVQILTSSSVEVATMANNHRLDYGQSGCDETERVLTDAGISYCYDDIYLIYEVKGVKVGIVAVNGYVAGMAGETWLKQGYQYLRQEGCSIVVACVHWGNDKTPILSDNQPRLGHKIIDMGYDLVVGHHPHVLQAIEVYKGKFICYSLGNFCYGGNKNPNDKDSGIFQQTFTVVDGELVQDTNAKFIPCKLSGVDNINDYRPTPATGAEYRRIIEKINSYSVERGFALNTDGTPIRMEHVVIDGHTHSFPGLGTVIAPTCTKQGYRAKTCICGEVRKSEWTSELGHQYGEYVSNEDATCTADGTKSALCVNCGEQVTVPDAGTALGHSYVVAEVIPPTASEQGYTSYTCTACGDCYMGEYTQPTPDPDENEEENSTPPDEDPGVCDVI